MLRGIESQWTAPISACDTFKVTGDVIKRCRFCPTHKENQFTVMQEGREKGKQQINKSADDLIILVEALKIKMS